MRRSILTLSWSLLIAVLLGAEAFSSVFSDPGIPDGEQIVWRSVRPDRDPILSIVTWHIKERDGKPVYEITTDSGEKKQGVFVIGKSDLRLIWAHVLENTKEGKSEIIIQVKDDHQYLVHDFRNKRKEEKIEHYTDGYNGISLPFSLRGFPFGKREEVELRATPSFSYRVPMWAWRMWKSYTKVLGEERITVPAGTFDCYKLETGASGGLIKRITSKYYFWYTKEPPHCFVKFQDKKGENMTELMEIRHSGKE